MKKWNKINILEYGIMIYFMINSTILLCMNYYINIGVDGYLVPIIGTIIGFIPLLFFIKILNYNKNLNIYKKIDKIFNKIGIFINILLSIIVYLLIIIIFKNLIRYIEIGYLYNTNTFLIAIVISTSILYTCTKSLNVLFRLTNILFYIVIILFIISIIGLLNKPDLNNLLPFLEYGINKPLTTSLMHVLYTVLPLFILLIIPKDNIYQNNKINKYIFIFYLLANLSIIIITIFTISILGIDLSKLYAFPEFLILSNISTTGFFQRFESILGIQWIFTIFIMLCICFMYIKNCYKHLFNKKDDLFIIILIIITSIICGI